MEDICNAAEARPMDPDDAVKENSIAREGVDILSDDMLKAVLGMLPNSHRFVSPVNKKFRDLYASVVAHHDPEKKSKKKRDATCKFSIASVAALRQYLDELQYIESREESTSIIGAGCGRKDWVERGGVFDELTCRAAAMGGQLRVLQWLRQRGCPWNSLTCGEAARYGHLEVLRWARGAGCPWDEDTCYYAARGGHVEVLRWALEHGCLYDPRTVRRFITDREFLAWFAGHEKAAPPVADAEDPAEDFLMAEDFFGGPRRRARRRNQNRN
eukprot:CAMPEP_0194310216 /NCGR_PEP_ID=MMETSP0171-20130528/7142_1 /TAXON_ID=218684 /ORGANISM="Corethron pennatum, Strain L29A3" /LENGTH=270 /DNA_ID=CAMNT_0039063719 /DNA_START=158 /DNA_END=970 /DNA_ORIENTATION=+